MAILKYGVSISAVPKKYGSRYRLINELVTHFESAQQDMISNNQKKLIKISISIIFHVGYVLVFDFKLDIIHKLIGNYNLHV